MFRRTAEVLVTVLLLAAPSFAAGNDTDAAAAGVPAGQSRFVVGTFEMGVGDERALNAAPYGRYDADTSKPIEGVFVRNEPVTWQIFGPATEVGRAGDSLTIKAFKKGSGYVLATRKCFFKVDHPKESLIPTGAKEGEQASRLVEIWVIKVTKGSVSEEEGGGVSGGPGKGGVTSDIPRAVIRGRTVMVGTHEPVEGAEIWFHGSKAGVIREEGWVSGSSGNFSIRVFERFVTGDYEVMARKASAATSIKGADGRPNPFTVMNDLWPVKTYIFSVSPAKAARGPIDVGLIEMNFVSNIWDGTKGSGRDTQVKVGKTPPAKGPGKGTGAKPPPAVGGGSAGGGAAPPAGGGTSGAGGSGGGISSGGSSAGGGGGDSGGGTGGEEGETAGPSDEGSKGGGEGPAVGEPETPEDEGESEPGEGSEKPTGGIEKPGNVPEDPGGQIEGPGGETEEPGEETEGPVETPPEETAPPPAGEPPAETPPPAAPPPPAGKPDIQIIEKEHPRPPPASTNAPGWTALPPSSPATPEAPPEATPPAAAKVVRRVSDLSKEELGDLLHCLCAASAGQSFGTFVAYDPKPSDASPSCKDPGNGPCIAGNWGCWRAFIDFAAPGATQCLASFGLKANDCDTLRALDNYNRDVEKPMRVELVADRTTIRVGESAVIRAEVTGGRPPYSCYWFAHGQNPYSSWNYENIAMGPSVRVWTNIPGQGAQQIMYIANTYEFKGGAPGKFEIRSRVMSSFYCKPQQLYDYSTCLGRSSPDYSELYHAPISPVSKEVVITVLPEEKKEEPPEEEEEEEAPAAPPSKPTHGGGSGYRPPPEVTAPSVDAPPPSGPSVSVPSGSAPATSGRSPDTPQPPETTVAPPQPPPPPEKKPEAPPPVAKTPPPPSGPTPPPSPPPSGEQGDCSFGGGGSALDNGPMNIFAEVPAGQRIRLTITGSDGFSQTVEGVGRVEISRPRNPSGTDTITMENLDVPGCVEQQVAQYDTNGIPAGGPPTAAPGLAGSEPGLGEYPGGAPPAGAGGALGGFVDGTGERVSADTAREFEKNQVFGESQIGEAKGQEGVREADAARDQGGWAAQGAAKASATATAAEDAKSGWGQVIGEGIFGGVQEGAEAAGKAFGGKAAEHVTEEIFDDGEKEEAGEGEEGSAEGSGGAQVAGGSSGSGASGDRDEGKSGGKKTSGKGSSKGGATKPGHVATDSVNCPSCGKLVTYPSGQQPKWCPYCCAGPDSVECAHCGYRWCGRNGPPPAACPSCGWRDDAESAGGTTGQAVPADVPAPAAAPVPAGAGVSP